MTYATETSHLSLPASDHTPPDIREMGDLHLVGLTGRFGYNERLQVLELWTTWNRLAREHLPVFPKVQIGYALHDDVNSFHYFAGCPVSDLPDSPFAVTPLFLPARRYLYFQHHGRSVELRETMEDIWANRIPDGVVLPQHPSSIHKIVDVDDPMEMDMKIDIYIPFDDATSPKIPTPE